MNLLAIDVGSSSVKMGLLNEGRVVGRVAREEFPTRYDAVRAEVDPNVIVHAIGKASKALGSRTARADVVALATMSPSWLAMDRRGNPITPIVTHQDRRSLDVAREIERRVGKARHLSIAGNRPVPGGISSTTCAWFLQNEPARMRKADLVGHLQTFLLHQFCGARVVDPSNASFMGVYSTTKLSGWNDELCDAIGLKKSLLPEVKQANEIAGRVSARASKLLGVRVGTPVLVGMVDTSAAMLLAGERVGQLVNVMGSTDVLALLTAHPHPHENLLLRGLGIGKRWVSVGTLASAGSSLKWARMQFFGGISETKFFSLVERLVAERANGDGGVRFEPYLAGDRCAVEQPRGQFTGLTLSTTREHMLLAMIDGLARVSAERIGRLKQTGTPMRHRVMTSGGNASTLAKVIHRDWDGKWSFWNEDEATMRGLWKLTEWQGG